MASRDSAPAPGSGSPASPAGDYVGSWYTWWPGDPLPRMTPIPGFVARPSDDDREIAALAGLDAQDTATFREAGNQPFIARVDGEAVACGWSAKSRLEIGEIGLVTSLPPGNR
jgi:hypothetical protein